MNHVPSGIGFAALLRNLKLIALCFLLALLAAAPVVVGSPPQESGATLQEPFIVKLKQPLRRSPSLNGEIGQVKAIAQSEKLLIDRWYASPEGLLLRMQATTYLDQNTKDNILRRLNRLPAVELATTLSAAAGQVQPALLANMFASDSEIPEPRLRGFRDFDKAAHEARIKPDAPHQKGVLFVKTKEEALFGEAGAATRTAAAADHARLGNRVKKVVADSENERSELIEFDEDQVSIMEMIRRYHALPWVEYAEPESIIFPLETRPGDVYANGSYGYHLDIIKAPLAWDIKHDTNQIVAIIDTGLWYRASASGQPVGHPDIRGTDSSRPFGNISADLANTNLVYSNTPNDPWDDTGFWRQFNPYTGGLYSGGHGTHVAGIIGALANNPSATNGISYAGVAWKCQILPFRIFDYTEAGNASTTSLAATAIDRAVGKGAKIINMSFGGSGSSQALADAVAGEPISVRGANKQTAMVVAAGNNGSCSNSATQVLGPTPTPDPGSGDPGDGTGDPPLNTSTVDPNAGGLGFPNNDTDPAYPASLPPPNLIAVANTISDASSSANDSLDCSSSYGPFTVDLAAPGTNIISTLNAQSYNAGYPYQSLTGTSMSAPHVSGTLALVRETFPSSTTWELLDRLRMGVDVLPAALNGDTPAGQLRDFKGRVSTGGRLNAYRALLPRSKMANVSCRAKVETGDGRVINGFILRSQTTVLIRGIGPSLTNFGVPGALADPYLQLFDGNGVFLQDNHNWKDTQQAEIQATGIPPTNDLESAIIRTLPAGAYTAQMTGEGNGQGIALTEVYELSPVADPVAAPDTASDLKRTQNLSSRVMVRGGDQIAILGLIVTGRGVAANGAPPATRRVLFRALGPSTGVNGALADPKLQLFDSANPPNMLAENNNWKDADTMPTHIYKKKIESAGFAPLSDAESIIIATLPPGNYTLKCFGADGGQGIALVEAYEY